eukprot:6185580-Pleurochrysis_carterae.AAC.3
MSLATADLGREIIVRGTMSDVSIIRRIVLTSAAKNWTTLLQFALLGTAEIVYLLYKVKTVTISSCCLGALKEVLLAANSAEPLT